MTISGILWLLLSATVATAVDPNDPKSVDAMMCGPATEVFLPDPQRQIAPNVRLEHLQFMSPEDPCGRNFKRDEITLLQDQLKAIAAQSFSMSKASFGVMVQYTLTAGSPAKFEMRTMDVPDAEKARLTDFYNAAKALKAFQPSSGTVYVAIQYSISPTPAPAGGG
jgi:hypothetical protein